MQIERIRDADLPALAALYQQLQPTESSVASMQEVLPRLGEESNHIILGAKVNGKLVGTVLAVVCQMLYGQCKRFMVVEDVVVDEQYRRKGIGSSLMRALEKHAVHTQCRYIMLITDLDRSEAQCFYEALAYESSGHVAFKKKLHTEAGLSPQRNTADDCLDVSTSFHGTTPTTGP
jgi:ribosomal protein S18 acetylase RimI-like enzyme